MKKIILSSLLLIAINLIAIEYNTYELEEEHVFNASHYSTGGINDLAVNNKPLGGSLALGPSIFFIDEKLVISDQVNVPQKNRTIFLNKDYSFNKKYNGSFYHSNVFKFEDMVIGFGYDTITCFDISKDWELKYSLYGEGFKFLDMQKDIYYQDNTLFIFDKDYKLWAIKNPGLDNKKNRQNIIKEDQIIQEIQDGKYKGLKIDSEKRLFLNGELQTVDYKVFYSFYKEQNPNKKKLSNDYYIDGNLIEISPKSSSYMTYISKDNYGNTYFDLGQKYITVFNKKGLLKEFFEYDSDLSDTTPAISPEGDVYFMKYGEDKVILYKVKRQW